MGASQPPFPFFYQNVLDGAWDAPTWMIKQLVLPLAPRRIRGRGHPDMVNHPNRNRRSSNDSDQLLALATLWAKARAAWKRDGWKQPERPTGFGAPDRWMRDDELYYQRVCEKAGLDGMEPLAICCLLDQWADGGTSYSTQRDLIAAAIQHLTFYTADGRSPVRAWALKTF